LAKYIRFKLGDRHSINEGIVPDGYLRFSDAVIRLAEGMWGGLLRPVPVQAIKRISTKASLGFGPWRERAGQRLTAAAAKRELVVYVIAKPQVPSKNRVPTSRLSVQIEPVMVPANTLERLITARGSLPDHPIRPSIKTVGSNVKLLALLTGGLLVVCARDFDVWYRSERGKGKWPSQRSRSKIGVGRPTKQTEALRNAVLALTHNGKWRAKVGITTLHRLLVGSGYDVPSPDTLARLVDQLHRETGQAELLRTRRRRRKRSRLV